MSIEQDVSEISAKVSVISARLTQVDGTIRQMSDDQYIANLDISNINAKTPDQGQTTMANSSPVVIASDQTPIPVSGSFSVVGGATSANQTNGTQQTQITDGVDTALITGAGELNVLATAQPGVDIGDVTVNNAAGAGAVNIQDGGNSITVDGTVTTVSSGTTAVNQTQINGVAVSTGTGVIDTGTQRVTLASDQPTIPVTETISTRLTYSASILGLITAATPTDIFEISGSGTRTIRIKEIRITGNRTTTATHDLVLVKRSTLNTAGTSTNPTRVPHDSADAAATALVKAYTANPTLGTLVGNLRADKQYLEPAGAGSSDVRHFIFGEFLGKPVVLRGVNESVAVNLNGVTVTGGNFDIWVEWIED